MVDLANPARTVVQAAVIPALIEEEIYGAFNDPAFFEPRFASGELHPVLRQKLLDEPLFTSATPGPAARYVKLFNYERSKDPAKHAIEGDLVLRVQHVTRTQWHTLTPAEMGEIDDGRRAYGR